MLSQRSRYGFLFAGLGALLNAGAWAAPGISNPGFEDPGEPSTYGAIPGWTQVPNPSGLNGFPYLSGVDTTHDTFFDNGITPDPTHVAFIQVYPGVATLTLQQTLSGFVAGQQYQLSYSENARAGTSSPLLQVNIDGSAVVAQHVDTAVESFNSFTVPFRTVTSSVFTAGSTTPTLAFVATQQSSGDDASALIDNIQITLAPEPASLGVLSLGALGLLARRRRI